MGQRMNYRTDLAVETAEMLEKMRTQRADALSEENDKGSEGGNSMRNRTGYIVKRSQPEEDISVTEIEITDEEGERAFGKRKGRYVTLELKGVLEQKDGIKGRAAAVLSDELSRFVKHDYFLRVLVVGLGNEKVTPDSLGPHTADKVRITSHLFRMFGCDGDTEYSNVCGFNPSVTGITGLETAELIERVVSMARPDVLIAIDALAAKNMERLSTTIQLCDTGIMPGAGMGNHRCEISERTVGCPVIAIGVPTVIDSRTLIMEAAEQIEEWRESEHADRTERSSLADREHEGEPASPLENYLASRSFDMIVTSTDIDEIIKDFSDIIADAINITLHPGIYSKVKP